MTNNWIYIDNLNITDEVMAVHCDTRDFHCALSDMPLKNDKEKYLRLKKELGKEKFLVDAGEITSFLKRIETFSGGKHDWRMLAFTKLNYGKNCWLKYIRFYRVENNKFIVTFNGESALEVADMIQENVYKPSYEQDD